MNTEKYLERIGVVKSDIAANTESLKFLQKQHLLNIPFENLDIHWKRPILLDTNKFYRKIIEEKRGGFCYELNGLFCELLNEIDFPSHLISARVANQNGDFSAEYDHTAILTKIGDARFLVDVGFGSFAAEPLKFITDIEQTDESGEFLIRKHTDQYFEVVKKDGGDWKSEYIFKDLSRELAEFTEMCDFHQTSPESHFTRGKICSLLLDGGGRKTLTDKKFIETEKGAKRETEVASEDEFDEILAREFEIEKNF